MEAYKREDSSREDIFKEDRGRYVMRIRNEGQMGKIGHDFQLKNIFASEMNLRAVTGYNEHDNTGQAQEGGT